MSSSSSPSASASSPNPVGLWFCQISSGLQLQASMWQQTQSSGVSNPPVPDSRNGAGTRRQATAPQPDAAGTKDDDVPVPVPVQQRRAAAPATTTSCRQGEETMSEATVYLLLDRFAPS